MLCSRGNGWNKKHATVNYVFKHDFYYLYMYHVLIIEEMKNRGYIIDQKWISPLYRGKKCNMIDNIIVLNNRYPLYPEHDHNYLIECIQNLNEKGILIDIN